MRDSSIAVQQVTSSIRTLGRVNIHLQIGNVTKKVYVHVLRGMRTQLILGLDSASYFNLSVNLESKSVTQGRQNLNLPDHNEKQTIESPLMNTLTSENLSERESAVLDSL